MSNQPSKQVEYTSNGFSGKVTVTEANVLQGIRRSRLAYEMSLAGEENVDLNIAKWLYSSLMAAAIQITINGEPSDMPFADFVQLPEAFVSEWERATYALNPHWQAETDEKKASD